MALLSIFGGVATIGLSGIFLGPVVAATVEWAVDYMTRRREPTSIV